MQFLEFVKTSERKLSAPLIGFPGLAFTGTTVKENLCDASVQSATLIALHNKFDFDIVFPMMDLTVEAEALGAEADWHTDEMPSISRIIVKDLAEAQALKLPEIGVGNRLDVFIETCATLKKTFPQKLVWGYVLGPFSIAGRLIGMTEIALATKLDPEMVHAVLKTANELLKRYIEALLATGIDGLMILEPASSMLRADDADEFSNNYLKELVELIKNAGKTPALHNCGSINHMIEHLCATGVEALHLGPVSDLAMAYPRIPENVVLMGNIDPASVLRHGSHEQVSEAVQSLCTEMSGNDRFVLSSGCDVPPGTTIENVEAFVKAQL